jgi:methylated-DNA-[protein]-cysteine S-methyltransferase
MYARDRAVIATPVGSIVLTAAGEQLESVHLQADDSAVQPPTTALLKEAVAQLKAWFAGQLTEFALPLVPAETLRGNDLRNAIAAIGYGRTKSYGDLAAETGSSARAVGQACARNPFPIIVPCHRVLAAGGRRGAYSAGDGPRTKQWLLDHEHRNLKGWPWL